MYLHSRNCEEDFLEIVGKNRHKFKNGLVHSFTGNLKELENYLELGLFIGVNGCSLKTEDNISIVKHIPLDKLMIETDAPYCEIRNKHASAKFLEKKIFPHKIAKKYNKDFLVKGRNEPCKIVEISEVLSKIMGLPEEDLC